jgi:transmembrane sensor
MSPERFRYLFQRYKDDILSQEEWEELRHVLRDGRYDTFLQEDFFRLMHSHPASGQHNADGEEALWQAIRAKGRNSLQEPTDRSDQFSGRTDQVTGTADQVCGTTQSGVEDPLSGTGHQGTGKIFGRQLLRYTAIAASLLLCISLVWLLRPIARHPVQAKLIQPGSSIHPGGNKAILTLANGEEIVLDSAQNGKIAQQGATTIIKLNGRLGYNTGNANSGELLYNTITTPKGGQYEIVLPDGSRVWLNSASSLKFPTAFKGKERQVELTGEGYFEIEKNAHMPFSVSINKLKVQVLGTSFNTMAYTDEGVINTTLLEGAVAVSEGDLVKRLLPGQQAKLSSGDHRLTVGKADIQKAVAWKNGLFEFDNTDLATIMRQLARWYDVEIIYRVTPDKTPLGGSISRSLNLTEVLNLLEANGINHFKIEGKKIIVLS